MNTKHTPAPWVIEPEESFVNEYNVKVVSIGAKGISNICHVFGNYKEDEANVKLIKAAPELLEVLIGLVNDVDSLLSDVAQYDFEWQEAGYFNAAKELIKKSTE